MNILKHEVLIFIIISIPLLQACSPGQRSSEQKPENFLEFYSTQSKYTDPGKFAHLYEGIPDSISEIVSVVQNNLVHIAQVEMQRLPVSQQKIHREINFKNIEQILKQINKVDDRPLICERPLEKRTIGICAHFAMLTCSILRYKGIPTRCRGGFEYNIEATTHHDHWICEYWNVEENRWIRIDPEKNDFLRKQWNIPYNHLDIPKDRFLTGGETWELCKSGKGNPEHFGIKGESWIGGWDFILNELVLDFLALNKIELLPWDGNDLSEKGMDHLKDEELKLLDELSNLTIAGNDSFIEMRKLYRENKMLQK